MTYGIRVQAFSALAVLALASACGGDTEGESIAVRWQVAGTNDAAQTFTTDTGWDVTLEEARIALDSVFAIAPPAPSRGAVARLSELFVSVAHAHGGHDDADGLRVRAEWLDPFAIDALRDRPERLGTVLGEAGDIATIKLEIAKSAEKLPDSLHGFQAYVRGVAEKDQLRIPFAGGVHVSEAEPARRIEAKVKFALSDGGALVLAVHPEEWLREAAFDRLPEAEDGGADRQITADSQAGRALRIGVRSPAAFEITYASSED